MAMQATELNEMLYTKTDELMNDFEVYIEELDGTLLPITSLIVDSAREMVILKTRPSTPIPATQEQKVEFRKRWDARVDAAVRESSGESVQSEVQA